MASIFTKIMNGEIKGTIAYQDDICAALVDIRPAAPKHFLIVPKKEIRSVNDATKDDQQILGHLLLTAAKVARDNGLGEGGYRLVINYGEHAGMSVDHIHVHVLGGRPMEWPPG